MFWDTTDWWIGHVLRHDGLLHEITEGRMTGKPKTRSRNYNASDATMLHDSAYDDGYVALNRQQRTDKDGDTEKGYQEPALWQKTANDDIIPVTQTNSIKALKAPGCSSNVHKFCGRALKDHWLMQSNFIQSQNGWMSKHVACKMVLLGITTT